MDATRKHRRRFLVCLAAIMAALAGVAVFNRAVNPYQVFAASWLSGDRPRGAPSQNVRMVAPYQLEYAQPDTLLLGSSRVHAGFSRDIPYLENAFNLSLPGASVEELAAYLKYAARKFPIRRVYIGIDLYNFFEGRRIHRHDFVPNRVGGGVSAFKQRGTDLASMLITWSATRESIRVLFGDPPIRESDLGFWVEAEPLPRDEFLARFDVATANEFRRTIIPKADARACDPAIRSMGEYLAARGIRADFFMHPTHVSYREKVLDPRTLSEIKQRVADAVALADRDRRLLYLWDFATDCELNNTPVDEEHVAGLRRDWFEATHYRPHVGGVLVSAMNGQLFTGSQRLAVVRIYPSKQ